MDRRSFLKGAVATLAVSPTLPALMESLVSKDENAELARRVYCAEASPDDFIAWDKLRRENMAEFNAARERAFLFGRTDEMGTVAHDGGVPLWKRRRTFYLGDGAS